MSTQARQRRGKRSGASDGELTPSSSTASSSETNNSDALNDERLNDAMARVVAARTRLEDLHAQWRAYLFRISLMVVLIAAHQSQEPMRACLSDVKEHNAYIEAGVDGEDRDYRGMGFPDAVVQVVWNGLCDWIGIALAGLVAYYLSMDDKVAAGDLTPWPYLVSTTLVFLQVSIFFQTKEKVGCAGRGLGGPGVFDDIDSSHGDDEVDRKRQFPVGVVFYAIATGTVWFMKSGKEKLEANAELVLDLKRQLEASKRKKGSKRNGNR